jgi:hypothetical protein
MARLSFRRLFSTPGTWPGLALGRGPHVSIQFARSDPLARRLANAMHLEYAAGGPMRKDARTFAPRTDAPGAAPAWVGPRSTTSFGRSLRSHQTAADAPYRRLALPSPPHGGPRRARARAWPSTGASCLPSRHSRLILAPPAHQPYDDARPSRSCSGSRAYLAGSMAKRSSTTRQPLASMT